MRAEQRSGTSRVEEVQDAKLHLDDEKAPPRRPERTPSAFPRRDLAATGRSLQLSITARA